MILLLNLQLCSVVFFCQYALFAVHMNVGSRINVILSMLIILYLCLCP